MLFHIQRVKYGGETSIGEVRVVAMAVEITQTTTAWLDDVSGTLTKSASSSKNGCDVVQGDGGL